MLPKAIIGQTGRDLRDFFMKNNYKMIGPVILLVQILILQIGR
jgi:hypothetical protein